MARSTGLKTVDAAIKTSQGRVHSVQLLTDGTNAATLVLYDHASAASGTVLVKVVCVGADLSKTVTFSRAVLGSTGIYADVSGTGARYIVHYT